MCVTDTAAELAISIHAPTSGATIRTSMLPIIKIFQSTLPQVERRLIFTIIQVSNDFNPRSHKWSDSNISQKNAFVSRNIINISKFVLKILPYFPLFKTNLNFLFIILGANLPAVLCALYTRTHCPHKIRVWSTAIPLSTPICSTFV